MEPKPIVELHAFLVSCCESVTDLPFISAGHNSGLYRFNLQRVISHWAPWRADGTGNEVDFYVRRYRSADEEERTVWSDEDEVS